MWRQSKYHSHKAVVNGIEFDSKKEAKRYQELLLLERAGEISHLQRQVKYVLLPKKGKQRETTYTADFVYIDKDANWHIEDVKGFRTEVYNLKKKMMYALLDLKVEEV